MKFKLNPAFEQASGALGELVFREVNGKTIVSRKPSTNGIITEAQAAHRKRFRQAAAYGKFAMANVATRAFYNAASEEKDIPAYALSVADFLNLPSIKEEDLSAYHGQPGDTIKPEASISLAVFPSGPIPSPPPTINTTGLSTGQPSFFRSVLFLPLG